MSIQQGLVFLLSDLWQKYESKEEKSVKIGPNVLCLQFSDQFFFFTDISSYFELCIALCCIFRVIGNIRKHIGKSLLKISTAFFIFYRFFSDSTLNFLYGKLWEVLRHTGQNIKDDHETNWPDIFFVVYYIIPFIFQPISLIIKKTYVLNVKIVSSHDRGHLNSWIIK